MCVNSAMDGVKGVEAYVFEPGLEAFVLLQVILLFPSAEYRILNSNLMVMRIPKSGFGKHGLFPASATLPDRQINQLLYALLLHRLDGCER